MLALIPSTAFSLVAGGLAGVQQMRSPVSNVNMALDRPIRVAVIGGGPSGACAAEIFAKAPNMETTIFERKMDNCKPCGGAIPLCMVDEFGLPPDVIDRRVRKMKMISPSGREVNIGQTLQPDEYIGMTRREILDAYLRDRAVEYGATPVNGLVQSIDLPESEGDQYTVKYSRYDGKSKGTAEMDKFDIIIGAVQYNFAIAFQERIKIPQEKMEYYADMAE